MTVSLLDVADKATTDWYVLYTERTASPRWWNRYLKSGFRHVQVWRGVKYGPAVSDTLWVGVDPCVAMLHIGAVFLPQPPWTYDKTATVQHVFVARGTHMVRDWFSVGPMTCVEIVKACLGISSFFIRTPWQLYKHIDANGGALISK